MKFVKYVKILLFILMKTKYFLHLKKILKKK